MDCKDMIRNSEGYEDKCNKEAYWIVDLGEKEQFPICKHCASHKRVHKSRLTIILAEV